jgi:hypothetical protein
MSFLAFPLRLEGAFLRRTGEPEAVLQLLSLMARTPVGSFAGCRSFGVRDYFEGMRLRPDGLAQAVKAINAAFEDLGITNFRLEGIGKEPSSNPDVDAYALTIVDTSGRRYSVSVGRKP